MADTPGLRGDDTTFGTACALIEAALGGTSRAELLEVLTLPRLREHMRSNSLQQRFVRRFDAMTCGEGFNVLHDWDGKADSVNRDIIPIDVLTYLIDTRGAEAYAHDAVAILLDYYYFHLLALLAMRIWDEGDADANLDRVAGMLGQLQGSNGSGQRFADDAETLILIGTSHFELFEDGYYRLLARVRTLSRTHQINIALGHAASMGSHLRFGFQATYARDTVAMRDDNTADYPWLCFSLVTILREYARLHGAGVEGPPRERVVEALLNGLSPDPRAFIGEAPASLSRSRDRTEFLELYRLYRDDLLAEFERHRPDDRVYSPLSFFFNFSHNVLKGTIVDALLRGRAWDVSFNDLLSALGPRCESKAALARTLMGHARSSPDRIRGRLMPVIVFDPDAGREAFRIAMRKLRE
jgi:hypothetical protein